MNKNSKSNKRAILKANIGAKRKSSKPKVAAKWTNGMSMAEQSKMFYGI